MTVVRSGQAGRRDDTPGGQASVAQLGAALAYVLRSTAARPQTEAEVAAKLESRGYHDAVVHGALAAAREHGAVDDRAFALAWVRDRGERRGFGVPRLRAELRRRQVPDDIVDEALETLQARDDRATAVLLARRRAAALPARLDPPAVARRLHAYLVRRGHGDALARSVASDVAGLHRYRDWD